MSTRSMPTPTVCDQVKVVLVPTVVLVASSAIAPAAGPAKNADTHAATRSADRIRFAELVIDMATCC